VSVHVSIVARFHDRNNYADAFGGGMYDTVGIKATDRHPIGTQLLLHSNFTDNIARGGGGGLYWLHAETRFLLSSNRFQRNDALWGPQVATFRKVHCAFTTLNA